jgi:PiT family inorganic phosphate transporter/sulfate permease
MTALLPSLVGVASVGLAVNIGANNSAAEMGPAVGAGARSRRQALALIAIFCTTGAILAGGRVLHSIGHGLIGDGTLRANPMAALIAITAAQCLVLLANVLKVPLSTAHVVVGAMIGLGVSYGTTNVHLAGTMVAWWVATPVAALLLAYALARFVYPRLILAAGRLGSEQAVYRALGWALTLSGCWMAFSAGSNSLAKAMGPAVGAGVLSGQTAAVIGGLGMSLGALLFGGSLINTVGKEITKICPICAVLVELLSASIVFTASRFGMPVSLAEIVTSAVVGFSLAANGLRRTSANQRVRRMAVLWPLAPVASAVVTFGLMSFR